jgi:hypothetical protein
MINTEDSDVILNLPYINILSTCGVKSQNKLATDH